MFPFFFFNFIYRNYVLSSVGSVDIIVILKITDGFQIQTYLHISSE